MTLAGYRYGTAPKNGYSYNNMTGNNECGVSMASVSGLAENNLFATLEAKQTRNVFYYVGQYAGIGGDDEVCLKNVKKITKKEYKNIINNTENTKFRNKKEAEKEQKKVARINELKNRLMSDMTSWQYCSVYHSNYDDDKAEYYELTK